MAAIKKFAIRVMVTLNGVRLGMLKFGVLCRLEVTDMIHEILKGVSVRMLVRVLSAGEVLLA
jgi:hypothetical protein